MPNFARKILISLENRDKPITSIKAKIIDKGKDIAIRHIRYQCQVRAEEYIANHFIIFQLEDGVEVKLNVSSKNFDSLACGAEGTLTFKGTKYLSFK